MVFLSHRKTCLERQDRVRGSDGPPAYWLDLQTFQGTHFLEGQLVSVVGMLLVQRRAMPLNLCLPSHLQLMASS